MAEDREQQIKQRAYRIWQEEGEPAGRDQDHWSRAEAELGTSTDGDGQDELVPGSSEDLPFGEPEDTGADDASLANSDEAGPDEAGQEEAGADETPQTSGIAAAAEAPIAPAPAARKGKGAAKKS